MNSQIESISIYSQGMVEPPERNDTPNQYIDVDEYDLLRILEETVQDLFNSFNGYEDFDTGWIGNQLETELFRVSKKASKTAIEIYLFANKQTENEVIEDIFSKIYNYPACGISALMERWNINEAQAKSVVNGIVELNIANSDAFEYVWGIISTLGYEIPDTKIIIDLSRKVLKNAKKRIQARYSELQEVCESLNVSELL